VVKAGKSMVVGDTGLTVPEFAAEHRCSVAHVYKLLREGRELKIRGGRRGWGVCWDKTGMTVADAARKYGVSPSTVTSLIRRGEDLRERVVPRVYSGRLSDGSVVSGTIRELGGRFGLTYACVKQRLMFDKCLDDPVGLHTRCRAVFRGRPITGKAFAKLCGISTTWLYELVKRGMSFDEIGERYGV